jgi:hypothetical protein
MPPPAKPAPNPAPGSPADEADRLAREHSNKREMKMRQDRARALADEAPVSRRGSVPVSPGAPVVQPRPRAPEPRDDAAPAEVRPRERAPERPPVERPERPVERPAERERAEKPVERRPSPEPSATDVDAGSASVIDDVAVEAEELLREQGAVWSRFSVADKISFVCAGLTFFGTLLPWLSQKNTQVVLGLGAGGVVHAAIAAAAVWLLIGRERGGDDRGMRPTPHQQRRRARRTALWMLLLALASTAAGTWFLLAYGLIRRQEVPTLEIEAGLYIALAAGVGLSYSGFAHFWRAGREPR